MLLSKSKENCSMSNPTSTPRIYRSQPKRIFSISLLERVANKLYELNKHQNRSMTAIVSDAIEEYYERHINPLS
jgi:hypothetical protein